MREVPHSNHRTRRPPSCIYRRNRHRHACNQSLQELLTKFAEICACQLVQVGEKSGGKTGDATGTRRQSSAATELDDAVLLQDMSKPSAGLEGGGVVSEAVSEAPPDQGCPAEDTDSISPGDEVSDEDIEGREKPDNKAPDTSTRPTHRPRLNSGGSRSSAEPIEGSGPCEDASSAGDSRSPERTSPDESAALGGERAAQDVSGCGGERLRGADITLPASVEKGMPSNDNVEEPTDAEITGSIDQETKDTQDTSTAQDTSMQSQRERKESAGELTRTGTETERSASEPHAATAAAKEDKGAQEGGQIVQQGADLEMSGSVEGSEHSRWSLPSGGGIGGLGCVREERAVWSGLADAEDSMGSAEQAPSSISGERGADGKSPRSRVESYDLQQEEVSPNVRRWSVWRDVFKSASGARYIPGEELAVDKCVVLDLSNLGCSGSIKEVITHFQDVWAREQLNNVEHR